MTTIACDLLVVGSALGGLVAGSYAARAGLRVTLIEEDAQSKRPPILREPFLLGSGANGGPTDLLLRELRTSPVERQRLRRSDPAVQVVLPGTRVDLGGGRARLRGELEAYGLSAPRELLGWLEDLEARGNAARGSLGLGMPLGGGERLWSRLRGSRTFGIPEAALAIPPGPPERGLSLVAAAVEALSRQAGLDPRKAPALLLRSTLEEGIGGPDASSGLLELLRQRFLAFHGDVKAAPALTFTQRGREVGVQFGTQTILARALLVAAPAALLLQGRTGEERGPRWLRGAPDVLPISTRLIRAERAALSSGMGTRVVDATLPGATRWILRSADPLDDRIEWIVVRAPHFPASELESPLGRLAPFGKDRLVPVDPGPHAHWDLGGDEVRIRGPGWSVVRSWRPLVLSVGADVAPMLGTEGELLLARRVGLWLVDLLGSWNQSPR